MNWDIINPTVTTRLWTVEGSNWDGGRFHSFWLKRNAIKSIDEFKRYFLFVTLVNEWTGERIRVKDNPENIQDEVIILGRER